MLLEDETIISFMARRKSLSFCIIVIHISVRNSNTITYQYSCCRTGAEGEGWGGGGGCAYVNRSSISDLFNNNIYI